MSQIQVPLHNASEFTPCIQTYQPIQLSNGQIVYQILFVPLLDPSRNSLAQLESCGSDKARTDSNHLEQEESQALEFEAPQLLQDDEVSECNPQPKNLKCNEEFPTLVAPAPALARNLSSTETDSSTESGNESLDSEKEKPAEKEFTRAFIYRTVKRIRVRADRTIKGEVVGILDKDTKIKVVKIEGKKARIVSPLNGWVSTKKKKLKQIVQVFKGTPTICLQKIPRGLRKEDVLQLLRKEGFCPTRCIWHKTYAYIEFVKHKDAYRLLKSDVKAVGVSLNLEWSYRYANEVDV